MRRRVGMAAFRQQFPKKSIDGRCEGAIAPTSSPSDIASWPIDQVRFSGTVRHTTAPGGRWSLQMNSKWTKLAAAGFLSLWAAAPALAGSVTQPGETVGLNTGTPLAPGWYAINTVDWGCQEHHPTAHVYGSHHSGRRVVNAVDDFRRKSTVAGGVARSGSRRATQPRHRSRHLL